ncbi:hypothetical protein [Streptomyces sp. NPDC048521]|uniref:hypothetical protein n=1 Tax=Streptomyces sp. NPDC048521 TaxID=3365566 RepID=UPI0037132B22
MNNLKPVTTDEWAASPTSAGLEPGPALGDALTPHEARQKAEARVAELEEELRQLRGELDG